MDMITGTSLGTSNRMNRDVNSHGLAVDPLEVSYVIGTFEGASPMTYSTQTGLPNDGSEGTPVSQVNSLVGDNHLVQSDANKMPLIQKFVSGDNLNFKYRGDVKHWYGIYNALSVYWRFLLFFLTYAWINGLHPESGQNGYSGPLLWDKKNKD